ncbi:restriction endonuclease subunit S [uncultured Mobiluncus sp.]|uniref:restriction endonuclease subunit S n=1 Tax=uncultured Mobiluncus sp. TaxID=293425 RepID=UPI0025F87085|nr:restriction endonuclease subunit S [uncultured Mobiluncus sp.]
MIAEKLWRSYLNRLVSPELAIQCGWTRTTLSKICVLKSGRDLLSTQYASTKTASSIPYITGASNFIGNYALEINRYTESPVVIAEPGDVLITVKGTIGDLAFVSQPCHIARQVMAVRSRTLDPEYLALILEAEVDRMKAEAKSMIPGISRKTVLNLSLSVPPKNEQKCIAEHSTRLFAEIKLLAELERERERI